MLRLGLTGGIGSGKSTVANMLRARGATVVDADAISRQTTQAGGAAMPAIHAQFGAAFVTEAGSLDRDRMREASFSDPAARKRLEAIVHPLVAQETARQEADALQSGAACVVFDIPLLVESRRWRQRVDHVLVVDCPTEVQVRRVVARNALSEEAVLRIIASQATRAQRVAAADTVLFNGADGLERLAQHVAQFAKRFGL
jgi:dephospho-CoA kinase